MQVVEQVHQIVNFDSISPPSFWQGEFFPGRMEDFWKATEQECHGNIGFGPSVMGEGINPTGPARRVGQDVSNPEVAVEQRSAGLWEKFAKSMGHPFSPGGFDGGEKSIVPAKTKEWKQSTFHEEIMPIGHPSIGKEGRTQIAIFFESERRTRCLVDRSHHPTKALPIEGFRGAGKQVFENQEMRRNMQDFGHSRANGNSKSLQCKPFGGKLVGWGVQLCGFGNDRRLVRKLETFDG